MLRPGDDPTLLDPLEAEAVLVVVANAFQRWLVERRIEGRRAPDLLIVFGSFGARPPRARAASDLDVAVAGDVPLDLGTRLDLALALGEAVGREVDVVDLMDTHGSLLHAALSGRVLHERDASRRASLLSRLWTEQEDFGSVRDAMLRTRRRTFLGATS